MAKSENNGSAVLDVLIIGAGLSGVGAACHLQRECPDKSFALLERRDEIGGTWDLFRYPGIRSDSDMYTMGYNFKPWTGTRVLADGPSIKGYVKEAAEENHVYDRISFGRKVVSAAWDSHEKLWTVTAVEEASGRKETHQCRFLLGCTGYYNYDAGFTPDFPGRDDFKGEFVHPQHWPEDLDYSGKKVVVIGSGATAVTLVPAMAEAVEHITMLQRSPGYIMSLPGDDFITKPLSRWFSHRSLYRIGRAKNVRFQRFMYKISKERPAAVRRFLLWGVRRAMGKEFDMTHFTPRYNPWDERLCFVPDGDLFEALKSGKAEVVTDHIDRLTSKGIKLKSGRELEADIIVSATGLQMQIFGGMEMQVDGRTINVADHMTYKGVMVNDVPNLGFIFGYTNASWTLKADIAAEYVCRLLNHMDQKGCETVVARDTEGCKTDMPFFDLQSNYVKRAKDVVPKQGTKEPWKVLNNYLRDRPMLENDPIDDGVLQFDSLTAEESRAA